MKKKVIGLIDGQSGNIGSINKAIKDIIKGRPYQLKIIKSHFNYSSFDKIILPGQGAYATLMSNLKKLKIIQPLKKYLKNNSSYLGICVGMQILSDWGYEDKTTRGLGIISGDIKKFKNKKLIIPHMGWNTLKVLKDHPVLENTDGEYFYFVHSYYPRLDSNVHAYGQTTYETDFISALGQGNFFGTQFHPEKSAEAGLRLIGNFLSWDGKC